MEGSPAPEGWVGQGVLVLVTATATTRRTNVAVPGVLEEVNDRGVHLLQDTFVEGNTRMHRQRMFYPCGSIIELQLIEVEDGGITDERISQLMEEVRRGRRIMEELRQGRRGWVRRLLGI